MAVVSAQDMGIAGFVDLAVSQSDRAHYTAIAVCGLDKYTNFYICDVQRGRWSWPETRERIATTIINFRLRLFGIESQAFQLAAVQDFAGIQRTKASRGIIAECAVFPVTVDTDKLTRALPLAAKGSQGKLFIANGAPWSRETIDQFLKLPSGKYDDIVDAISGCYKLLYERTSTAPVIPVTNIKRVSPWRKYKRRTGY
jgi:predicted phage terminase large subunit-like protein